MARTAFITNGKLGNTENTTFRAIGSDWPVFALSQDLGTVDWQTTRSTVFSIGHIRDPVVQYNMSTGIQNRSPLFLSRFSSVANLVSSIHFFHTYAALNLER